jgi:hypothetical protein
MPRDVNDTVVLGFGGWSDVNALPTLGFGVASANPTTITCVDAVQVSVPFVAQATVCVPWIAESQIGCNSTPG